MKRVFQFLETLFFLSLFLLMGCPTEFHAPPPPPSEPKPSSDSTHVHPAKPDTVQTNQPKATAVFQLSQIRDGENSLYTFSNELTRDKPSRLFAFISLLDSEKLLFSIRIFEDDEYVYGADIYAKYTPTIRSLTLQPTAVHETQILLWPMSTKRFVTPILSRTNLNAKRFGDFFQAPHPTLADRLGSDFDHPLTPSAHFKTASTGDEISIQLNASSTRKYLFLAADQAIFQLPSRKANFRIDQPFKTITPANHSNQIPFRVWADKRNVFNMTSNDDIYVYEPLIQSAFNEISTNLMISGEDAHTLLKQNPLYHSATLQPYPGLRFVRITTTSHPERILLQSELDTDSKALLNHLPTLEDGDSFKIEYLTSSQDVAFTRIVRPGGPSQ